MRNAMSLRVPMILRALVAAVVGVLTLAPSALAAPGISGTVGPPSAPTFGAVVTFSGTVTNTGTTADDHFTSVAIVDAASTGLAISSVSTVDALAIGQSAPFTVTARVTAAPGSQAQLRLRATGSTASPSVADPQVLIEGTPFVVQDAVVLTVSAQRKRGGVYEPCPAVDCTVSIQDSLNYTVKLENVSDVFATATISAPTPANTTNNAVVSTIPTTSVGLSPGTTQTYVREVSVNDTTEPGEIINFTATATYTAQAGSTTVTSEPARNSPGFLSATVVDPRLTVTNELTDANGASLLAGEQVQSTILVDNTGNANATSVVATIDLTNLRSPTDVRINGVLAETRATVNDNQLVVRIGSGANSIEGGTIAPSDSPIAISFNSVAAAVATESQTVRSDASVSFADGGISPQSASDELPLTPVAPAVTGTLGAPTTTIHGRTVTFSGTVTNAGATDAPDFTGVSFADVGSVGLTDVSVPAVGPLAAGATAPFTATATISGVPGTQARLRLRATGTTASAEVPDPEADIDGSEFAVEAAPVTDTVTPGGSPSATASPAPTTTVTPVAPTGLTLAATPKRDRRLPYIYKFTGKLGLPAGVTAAQGCFGKVTVRVKKGTKTISTRTVQLTSNCAYVSKGKFTQKHRLRRRGGTLKVLVRFLGNARLAKISARTRSVQYG